MTAEMSAADAGRLVEVLPASATAGLLLGAADWRGDGVAVKDAASGRYLFVNAAMAALVGREPGDVVGRTDAEIFDGQIAAALRAAEQTAIAQGVPLVSDHRFEWLGQRRDYSVLRLVTGSGASGDACRVCSLWSDQAEAHRRQAQLEGALRQLEQQQRANEALRRELADAALRDGATGLYTRAHFDDQLRREVDLSTREHREFALVFIELDPPSEAVEALGGPARDRILDAMGRLLRGGTRAMDASCRVDERRFAVLLSGVGLATAHSRMEGLRRQCATQIVALDGQDLGFTVSMGVASYPHTAHSQDELVAACAAALAEAQRRGGNHVTLASIRFERS